MKRFTLIVALVLIVTMPMFAERVTPETARKVATTFLNNNGAKASQLVDLTKAAGFSNLYIFTTDESFVVMAADDCVKPILGYSLTGRFITECMPDNIGSWLQGYSDEIQYAIENRQRASLETAQLWRELLNGNSNIAKATTVVSPLIQTQWGQGSPYSDLCPSGSVTGCVATAMAQVMNYWNYPLHGIGSYSYIPKTHPEYGELSADFNSTNYDWDNMTNTYNSSSNEIQNQAVATLMYHCGITVDMDYGPIESLATTSDVVYALKTFFNYSANLQYYSRSNYSDVDWINMLKSDLILARPIQYRGKSSGGGHSFICDGYNSDNYFHFNWGYCGDNDAYYLIDNLNPGSGGVAFCSYRAFNDNQGAIFGVHPSECIASAPTNLSFTQNERNVTLSWTGASGAASYNIYRNNNYVGNSTTTSYSEIAPWGNNTYYVRSVDTNDELSLSSNAVDVTVNYQTPVVDDLEATLSGNTVNLSWSAPEWCFPQTESAILTYGDGTSGHFLGYSGSSNIYWGHRYLPSDLTEASDKVIFRVSFFVRETGTYELNIYKGTTVIDSYDIPTTLLTNKTVTATQMGWFVIDLEEPIAVDNSQDLWVMMYDPESKYMPAEYCIFDEHDRGGYFSTNINSWTFTDPGSAFLIRTYLTDGTYTYNLYQDGAIVAENLAETTYDATLNNNTANLFTIKTNYYGGMTEASNKIAFANGNAFITSLNMNTNDKMTITEGSMLTVSSTLSNSEPTNLVLENGAQLIHNTPDVQATVKKNIFGYNSDDNGWYFIASPVAENTIPSENNGFLNGTPGQGNNTYDLYYYDEPNHLWKNYESQTFVIENKKGYLYANGETDGTTLQFSGTLSPSNESITINNLSHSATTLNGFNLVGNPFACNVTVDQDYYIVNGRNVSLPESGHIIAPCDGVLVQASENHTSVTFAKATSTKDIKSTNCMDLVVMQNKTSIDRARVRFGEGEGLEKFNLGSQHSQISFQHNGQDFAVVYAKDQSEMPVNFKACENGTYTINIEAEGLELDYLHLVDNLTGNDVDLLDTPNYTFEAKVTDYATRFRLVFNANATDGPSTPSTGSGTASGTFAFIGDGNIIINQEGEATLQIVDMTGRILYSETIQGNYNKSIDLNTGVYIIRLLNADKTYTQKMVVQ